MPTPTTTPHQPPPAYSDTPAAPLTTPAVTSSVASEPPMATSTLSSSAPRPDPLTGYRESAEPLKVTCAIPTHASSFSITNAHDIPFHDSCFSELVSSDDQLPGDHDHRFDTSSLCPINYRLG
ncbi:hypothetical protein BGZ89_002332 [Linnemannia elongata]|nr:hypothetical protein BGZ89_002332 [Linnemannia elongata]